MQRTDSPKNPFVKTLCK